MKDDELRWRFLEQEPVLHTPIFDVIRRSSVSPTGLTGDYYAIGAGDWVMVIPKIGEDFLMVRQWRHGGDCMTTEFPGGVMEPGEDPMESAKRELEEETGYRAGKLTKLGALNPNPALYQNRLHIFLAEDLLSAGQQHLDADEYIHCVRVPMGELTGKLGTGEYGNALMASALALLICK